MTLPKDFQLLDNKLFKAFMAAAEAENFTAAAQAVHMTQSGISQHIAKLEEQIGLPLFKRIGKQVVLTDAGSHLRRFVRENAHFTETFLDELHEGHQAVSGLVSYAMPASCLLSPHFMMLLEKRKTHPEIRLNVTLAPTPDVLNMVLDDKVDFGFVTTKSDHPALQFQLFCQEEYILVGADPGLLHGIEADRIAQHPCITYPGAEVYFGQWLKHHFPDGSGLDTHDFSIAGYFSSIEGAIKMVEGGLGISVFPRHCVMEQLERGVLFEYASDAPPLLNDIYIATIAEHAYRRVVQQVIDWFLQMHCSDMESA